MPIAKNWLRRIMWHPSFRFAGIHLLACQLSGYPHHIVIDLGEDKKITGLSYLTWSDANKPGMIKDYKVYIKTTPFVLK